jgi:CBS domain-containing protein
VTDNAIVADVMTSPVLTLAPETPIHEAASGMLESGIKSLVVIDDACQPLGIFTSTDAVRLAAEDRRASETTVGDHMTTDVVTTSPGTTLSTVAARLREEEINHLPVTEGDEVVGILTTTDLAAFLADGSAGSGGA